jgi:hypothetical protein
LHFQAETKSTTSITFSPTLMSIASKKMVVSANPNLMLQHKEKAPRAFLPPSPAGLWIYLGTGALAVWHVATGWGKTGMTFDWW